MLALKKTSLALLLISAPALSFASIQPVDCVDIEQSHAAAVAQAHAEIEQSDHYHEVENDVAAAQDCMLDLSEMMGGSVGHGQLDSIISAMKEHLNDAACDSARRLARNAKNQANQAVRDFENEINEGIGNTTGGGVAEYIESISEGSFAQNPDQALREWAAQAVQEEAQRKAAELQAELERRGYANYQTPQERLNDLYDSIARIYQF